MHPVASGEGRLERETFEPESHDFRTADTIEYLLPSPLAKRGPELDEFVTTLPPCDGTMIEVVGRLMDAVRSRLVYEKKVTTAKTAVGEALRLGRGVCQDFAHLFLAACRGIGLPSRYVSGYIHLPGEVATHAWCQVWAGRSGWVDVDHDSRNLSGRRSRQDRHRPRLLRRPAQPRPLERPGQGGDRRQRHGRGHRPRPARLGRVVQHPGPVVLGRLAPVPATGPADEDRLRRVVVPTAAGTTAAALCGESFPAREYGERSADRELTVATPDADQWVLASLLFSRTHGQTSHLIAWRGRLIKPSRSSAILPLFEGIPSLCFGVLPPPPAGRCARLTSGRRKSRKSLHSCGLTQFNAKNE